MKITYIHHSGYAVQNEKSIYVFDYYKKDMPDYLIAAVEKGDKDVYFFVSHGHADHFNPEIFGYAAENVYYIVSHDIKEKIEYRKILDDYEGVQIEYISPYDNMNIQGKNGSLLLVETLKSTDRGVAFIVTSEGKSVYHAGDLNNWIFDGMDKAKLGDMKARYTREIDKIEGRLIEVAFLPVDYRLGDYIADGPAYFLEKVYVNHIFPMHMWKEYDYIEIFKNKKGIEKFADKVYTVNEPGLTWEI